MSKLEQYREYGIDDYTLADILYQSMSTDDFTDFLTNYFEFDYEDVEMIETIDELHDTYGISYEELANSLYSYIGAWDADDILERDMVAMGYEDEEDEWDLTDFNQYEYGKEIQEFIDYKCHYLEDDEKILILRNIFSTDYVINDKIPFMMTIINNINNGFQLDDCDVSDYMKELTYDDFNKMLIRIDKEKNTLYTPTDHHDFIYFVLSNYKDNEILNELLDVAIDNYNYDNETNININDMKEFDTAYNVVKQGLSISNDDNLSEFAMEGSCGNILIFSDKFNSFVDLDVDL